MTFLLFFAQHVAALALLLLVAAATGTLGWNGLGGQSPPKSTVHSRPGRDRLLAGRSESIGLRLALGLAICGQILVLLGVAGLLRSSVLLFIAIALTLGGLARTRFSPSSWLRAIHWPWLVAIAIGILPLFLLALFPPIAFDETLYHLPFVQALARSGTIEFLGNLRFPAFPQLHELLCVPLFLAFGDTATHLVALVELIVLAALLLMTSSREPPLTRRFAPPSPLGDEAAVGRGDSMGMLSPLGDEAAVGRGDSTGESLPSSMKQPLGEGLDGREGLPSSMKQPLGEGLDGRESSRENQTSRASPLRRGEKVPLRLRSGQAPADEGSPSWQNSEVVNTSPVARAPFPLLGMTAASLCLGHPIVVQLATVNHVEMALTLFVAAAFICLDRMTDPTSNQSRYAAAAGFFLGTACCVKYLGWYFALAGFAFLLLFGPIRKRTVPIFLCALAIAVVPMYGEIVHLTGNPVHPFLGSIFGATPWALPVTPALAPSERFPEALRLLWDVTFARERLNQQPPYSPLFALSFVITLLASTRSRRAAFVALGCVVYIAIFTFLPQDSRYLLPLLPLVSIVAARVIASWLRAQPRASVVSRLFSWVDCARRWVGCEAPRRQRCGDIGEEWRRSRRPAAAARHPRKQSGYDTCTIAAALSLFAIAPAAAYAGYRLAKQGMPPATAAQHVAYLEQRVPEYQVLQKRGPGITYLCGAEELQSFGDSLLGDVNGLAPTQKIFGQSHNAADLAKALKQIGARNLLVSRARCPPEWQSLPREPYFQLIHEDEGAALWRVRPVTASSPPTDDSAR